MMDEFNDVFSAKWNTVDLIESWQLPRFITNQEDLEVIDSLKDWYNRKIFDAGLKFVRSMPFDELFKE